MSLYKETLAYYKTQTGDFGIDFRDDLGREYRLEFQPDEPRTHYDSITNLSDYERSELESWESDQFAVVTLPDYVLKFINASFMEWVEVVEVEDAN